MSKVWLIKHRVNASCVLDLYGFLQSHCQVIPTLLSLKILTVTFKSDFSCEVTTLMKCLSNKMYNYYLCFLSLTEGNVIIMIVFVL